MRTRSVLYKPLLIRVKVRLKGLITPLFIVSEVNPERLRLVGPMKLAPTKLFQTKVSALLVAKIMSASDTTEEVANE